MGSAGKITGVTIKTFSAEWRFLSIVWTQTQSSGGDLGPQNMVLHSTQKRIISLAALLREGAETKCNEPAGAGPPQNQG